MATLHFVLSTSQMSTSASLFPSNLTQMELQLVEFEHLTQMEQQLTQLEHALDGNNAHSDDREVQLNTDDLFDSFLASTTPHPSTQSLTGVARMESSSSTASEESTTPLSPSSLPPLSPVSLSSPLPSPVLSPIGSLPASPSSFSLSSSSSDLSFSPSPSSSPAPARRKYTKSKAANSSESTTLSSPTPSPVKRRGVKRELSPSPDLDDLDPVAAKKERRKQQNRNAAATSREKKQKYMAEMEERIEKLIREQQQLMDDVQRLQEQNKKLKLQVHERESGDVQVAAVKAESVKPEQQCEVEEHSVQLQASEHVSQDHVSACTEPAVEGDYEENVSECSEWSSVVLESRDVYHESAVLGAPQWQTSRTLTPPASLILPLTLLPLTTLYLFLHSTLLLLSTVSTASLLMQSQHPTSRSSTRTTSLSRATATRTTAGCSWSPESTADVLDTEGGECCVADVVASLSVGLSLVSLHCRPALVCR